jgi:uncharacterized protein
MERFVGLLATPKYARCSLVTFFEPDENLTNHSAFVHRFWQVLQLLHERDPRPAIERTPDHPLWEFSFAGCEMFAVGASPTYANRRSRNLGPGIVIIFQPRILFLDPTTSAPIAAEVRQRIHRRMLAYDGMTVHPDIGFYGQATNREWKQYALPDDNLRAQLLNRQVSCWTHWRRQAGASKGSAKYCVSCTTLPSRNSMMLTVNAGRSW